MPNSSIHPLDRLPRYPTEEIPPEEFDAIHHAHEACRLTMQSIEEFSAALTLFDFCTNEIEAEKNAEAISGLPLVQWRRMAGRDTGMAMYHCGMSMVTVGKFVGEYPWLSSQLDASVVKESRKMMNKRFRY